MSLMGLAERQPLIKRERWQAEAEHAKMELFVFVRFHAREGQQDAVAAALHDVLGPSRDEPGCVAIEAFRSTRDDRLFYVHSRWIDEAAFDIHARLAYTVQFLERVRPLVDHAVDVVRTRPLSLSP